MRSTLQLSNSSMLMRGLCVLVGSCFTIGAGVSSGFPAPPSNPNPTTRCLQTHTELGQEAAECLAVYYLECLRGCGGARR